MQFFDRAYSFIVVVVYHGLHPYLGYGDAAGPGVQAGGGHRRRENLQGIYMILTILDLQPRAHFLFLTDFTAAADFILNINIPKYIHSGKTVLNQ